MKQSAIHGALICGLLACVTLQGCIQTTKDILRHVSDYAYDTYTDLIGQLCSGYVRGIVDSIANQLSAEVPGACEDLKGTAYYDECLATGAQQLKDVQVQETNNETAACIAKVNSTVHGIFSDVGSVKDALKDWEADNGDKIKNETTTFFNNILGNLSSFTTAGTNSRLYNVQAVPADKGIFSQSLLPVV